MCVYVCVCVCVYIYDPLAHFGQVGTADFVEKKGVPCTEYKSIQEMAPKRTTK